MDFDCVNEYLAHKQCLLQDGKLDEALRVTRRIAALHATSMINAYLSLWSRMPSFSREALEELLYERRSLVKVRCMRESLFLVPSDEMAYFFQAYAGSQVGRIRDLEWLITQVGLAEEGEASEMRRQLQEKVFSILEDQGPSTVQMISRLVPELKRRMDYMVGKTPGSLSLGSRLVPAMCDLGLLVRGKPRGTWKSSLYEYALLSEWLPEVDLGCVTMEEAQRWLVERYLAAFGPATLEDVTWWTGLGKGEVVTALERSEKKVETLRIANFEDEFLVLQSDLSYLQSFQALEEPHVFMLPALDPYIMGYANRGRFLEQAHYKKVFTRDGNAVPSLWVNGFLVGVWGQRKDGSVVYQFFEPVGGAEINLVEAEIRRLEEFLEGEVIPLPFKTKSLKEMTL